LPRARPHIGQESIRHLAFDEEAPYVEHAPASARLFPAIAFWAAICAGPTEPRRYVNQAYIPLTACGFYRFGLSGLILLHKNEKFTGVFIPGARAAGGR
jgi:hypothetical protein